jgi:hypothetical protein
MPEKGVPMLATAPAKCAGDCTQSTSFWRLIADQEGQPFIRFSEVTALCADYLGAGRQTTLYCVAVMLPTARNHTEHS